MGCAGSLQTASLKDDEFTSPDDFIDHDQTDSFSKINDSVQNKQFMISTKLCYPENLDFLKAQELPINVSSPNQIKTASHITLPSSHKSCIKVNPVRRKHKKKKRVHFDKYISIMIDGLIYTTKQRSVSQRNINHKMTHNNQIF